MYAQGKRMIKTHTYAPAPVAMQSYLKQDEVRADLHLDRAYYLLHNHTTMKYIYVCVDLHFDYVH